MKKLLIIPFIAFGLAACKPADVIKQVQADAILACGFVPAAAMIADMFAAAGTGQTAQVIANAICEGIRTLPTARLAVRRGVVGAPSFTVNSVRILVQGEFVR